MLESVQLFFGFVFHTFINKADGKIYRQMYRLLYKTTVNTVKRH